MTEESLADEAEGVIECPKDGTSMAPIGRRGRGGAYRCPACKSVFIDMAAMRRGRRGAPPALAPILVSVLVSVGMTLLVRRLRRRKAA
jgi:hypothetical protein